MEEILGLISAADADVVVLQEMRSVEEATGRMAALGYTHTAMGAGGFDLTNAVFSRLPLEDSEVLPLPLDPIKAERRCAVFARVLASTRPDGSRYPPPILLLPHCLSVVFFHLCFTSPWSLSLSLSRSQSLCLSLSGLFSHTLSLTISVSLSLSHTPSRSITLSLSL